LAKAACLFTAENAEIAEMTEIDLLVEETVIVEVKAIDRLLPIHQAQLLSYLKLSGCKVGLLINFNVRVLKDGIHRVVNDFPDSPRSLRSLR
jgi:GxxExxY protein